MSVRLIAVSGPLAGAAIPLTGEMTVGRDETNLLALADPSVSPRHCLLVRAAERVTIRDLDPANPTFVNGLPVRDEPLADGDQVQIGSSLFVLRLVEAEELTGRDSVSVKERPALAPSTLTLRREDLFAGGVARQN